jgi:antitoxin (DNA-binding transcriptional repressor) of toxin-antitoxin stability system
MKTMNASDFKARCLAILDEVGASGEVITILKRGRPVAQLVPPMYIDSGYPQRELAGSVKIHGDVVSPPLPASAWETENPPN